MGPKLEVPRTQEGLVVMGPGQACGQEAGPVLPTHPCLSSYRGCPGFFPLRSDFVQISSITCLMLLFECLFLPNIKGDTLNKFFQLIGII